MTSHAQTVSTVLNFRGGNGAYPQPSSLVEGADGNLYGTAAGGGAAGVGSIFRITPAGAFLTLHSFNSADGASPVAGLLRAPDGNFYGTAMAGGANNIGLVFRMTPDGGLTTLHNFHGPDGESPLATLVLGANGFFYGTTYLGGSNGVGTVFKITPGGVFTTLYNFTGPDGSYPCAALVGAPDGSFYGTTYEGGTHHAGTIFRITSSGALTTLHSFHGVDGANPSAALVLFSNGSFYGTTNQGGANLVGTVFKITPAGVLTTLHSFTGDADGGNPAAALLEGSGFFYGTTSLGGVSQGGTIFKISSAGALTTLHSFDTTAGANPSSALHRAANGLLYGTTYQGGSGGYGTVYSLSTGPGAAMATAASSSGGELAGAPSAGGKGPTGIVVETGAYSSSRSTVRQYQLYYRAGTPRTASSPVVVMIHGGGWIKGGIAQETITPTICHNSLTIACALAGQGYIVYDIGYTLLNEVASTNDLRIAGVNTVASASHRFSPADIGSALLINPRPNQSAQWKLGGYRIKAVNGTSAVLNASPGPTGLTGGQYSLIDGSTLWPAQWQDCNCFLRFLAESAGVSVPGNPNDIYLMGHSAGGHLASMAGLSGNSAFPAACEHSSTAYKISGIIAASPPTDLVTMYRDSADGKFNVRDLLGCAPGTPNPGVPNCNAFATAASPIGYVHEAAPPYISFSGALDTTVPPGNVQELQLAFAKLNPPVLTTWVEFQRDSHLLDMFYLVPCSGDREPVPCGSEGQVYQRALTFIQSIEAAPAPGR